MDIYLKSGQVRHSSLILPFYFRCMASSCNVKYLSEHDSIPEPPSLILTCQQRVSQVVVCAGQHFIAVIPLCLWRVLVSQHLQAAATPVLLVEIFMGFHNAMIMTKHRHLEFRFIFAPT